MSGMPVELFVNNPLDVKENYELALDFACHSSRFFCLDEFLLSCMAQAIFPKSLSDHCRGLRRTFHKICIQFDSYLVSEAIRNRIGPDSYILVRWCLQFWLHFKWFNDIMILRVFVVYYLCGDFMSTDKKVTLSTQISIVPVSVASYCWKKLH
jgi:hypothetical protein